MNPDDLPALLYKVAPGDTFYKLAERYNTTVEDISHANPLADPNNLQIGEILTIFPR